MPQFNLYLGDCLDKLKDLEDNSIDSIVTDPPYGLGFMGKKWDIGVPAVDVFIECMRVLKPGGHLLAFGGSRTYHRLAVAVEDAGFEIRDQIMWVYGSGFPKSHNISKAIDKSAGAERDVVKSARGAHYTETAVTGGASSGGVSGGYNYKANYDISAPATPEAQQWEGWGTALKPAHEPIVLARKPFKGTVANNVLEHGTGGVNIDGCRVDWENTQGRFPANLIHDGSDEVVAAFPSTKSGVMKAGTRRAAQDEPGSVCYGTYGGNATAGDTYGDAGSAARFFYCAKASKKDRGEGNFHPTVKPTALMAYLCRLITPPGGTVLDPFMGSGSTGKAAVLEGFDFVGIEMDPEYLHIAKARIEHASK